MGQCCPIAKAYSIHAGEAGSISGAGRKKR